MFQRRPTFLLRVLVKILPALANECSEVQPAHHFALNCGNQSSFEFHRVEHWSCMDEYCHKKSLIVLLLVIKL